jgi:hypothetical protein
MRTRTECTAQLEELNGEPYGRYEELKGSIIGLDQGSRLSFGHIQGSPGAMPASCAILTLGRTQCGLPESATKGSARLLGCTDFLLRAFQEAAAEYSRSPRGEEGSGSFQLLDLPQQVVRRNAVQITESNVQITFRISLPGTSRPPRILGDEAAVMLSEIQTIAHAVVSLIRAERSLLAHCDVVEDAEDARTQLLDMRLAAFVGDGALLPRASGVSDRPAPRDSVIAFCSPDSLACELNLPNKGRVRGMGIPAGVTVVIGGGFHGKSTLMNALAKGVYPHVPGDGRELVVALGDAVMVRAEDGRSVRGTDISSFIRGLPSKANPESFRTDNASGSTSQAAGLVEAICTGAKLLLFDEDSSATNFLIRDPVMRQLVPDDPITPFVQHARNLHRDHGISTVMVVGGSSEYLGIADAIVRMHNYVAEDATEEVRSLHLAAPPIAESMQIKDMRHLEASNFDPRYDAQRQGKLVPMRIKPLRGEPRVLEYGNDKVDLRSQDALVDETQTLAIGYMLLSAYRRHLTAGLSPSQLALSLCARIKAAGLEMLNNLGIEIPQLFAEPRPFEVAAAINRFRSLLVSSP